MHCRRLKIIRNKLIYTFIMTIFAMTFIGCSETIRLDKFILESEMSDGYGTENTVEITMRLTNNWKSINIQTGGLSGPFSYELYFNDDLVETLQFSVLRETYLKKSQTVENKTVIDTVEKGKYKIEVYARFRYADREYKICRQTIEFEKT